MVVAWIQIFRTKKCQKKAPCNCLSIIMLDSVMKAKKKYYRQIILEECRYEQEKNKNCLMIYKHVCLIMIIMMK